MTQSHPAAALPTSRVIDVLRRSNWRSELRETFGLAWPIAVTNILQMVALLTNTAIVGHLGTIDLAAVTIGSSLYFAVQPLTFGLGFAAAPLLAQARGRGRRAGSGRRGWLPEMRLALAQAILVVCLVTIPSWLLLWNSETVLDAIGEAPGIATLAARYVRTLMWGLPFLGLFIVLRGLLAAVGRAKLALLASSGQIPVNAVLCWLLVNGGFGVSGLGIAGAGLASTLVNLGMVCVLIILIGRDRWLRRARLFGSVGRFDRTLFGETFRIGLPIAGHMWVEIGLFAAATLAVGTLGALAAAAHAVAVQIAMLAYRIPMGVSEASTARVGLAAGAARGEAALVSAWVAVGLGAFFLVAMSLAIVVGAGILPMVFLSRVDPATPIVAREAAFLLLIVAAFQLSNGLSIVAAGALRGLRDTRVPAILAGLSYWGIGLPVALLLCFRLRLGVSGIWFGLAVGMTFAAVLLLVRCMRKSQELMRAAA